MTTTTKEERMTTLLGLEVEKCENDTGEGLSAAYRLHGPRGACYALVRNDRNPEMMFAINDRPGFFGCVSVKGYDWFYDGPKTDGVLTPVN
jgi:hypothetical protein